MKEDEKIWLKTKEGQKFFIYKTEKCDMQKELTETINNLQSQLKAKEEENKQLKLKVDNLAEKNIPFVKELKEKEQQLKEVIKEAREYNQKIVDDYLKEDDCEYCDGRYATATHNLEILSKGENK